MKPSLVKTALITLLRANRSVHLWGPPGIGKSDLVRTVAAALHLDLRDVRAVLLDPVDLRGLPHVNGDNRAHWAIPDFLPRDGAGILFLDELNAAPPLVQAACYQLVLDRRIGEYILPDGWRVVAAGNNQSDRAVVHAMPTPLRNRFVHIDVETDIDDWSTWAIDSSIRPEVIAFLRFRPELLHQFDPKQRDAKAFPTPRSWHMVSDVLTADPDPSIEYELVAGTVGSGAATEFTAFLRIYRELPSIDSILLDPSTAPVPSEPSALYAVAAALGTRASVGTIDRIIEYADRLPTEFNVLTVRDAIRRDASIKHTTAFVRWAVKHSDVIL